MIIAIILFILSLVAIAVLFAIKHWETKNERVFAAPLRQQADHRALEVKGMLAKSRTEARKLAPELVHLSSYLIHEAALAFAAFARFAEAQAHRLADLVSHKHHFERRETRSDYLKQVSEHKNGNGQKEVINTSARENVRLSKQPLPLEDTR